MAAEPTPSERPWRHRESSFPLREAGASAVSLRFRQVELEAREAEVRRQNAEAAVIEQLAANLEAEAAAKAGRAASVPAREIAEISAHWARMVIAALAFLVPAALLIGGS